MKVRMRPAVWKQLRQRWNRLTGRPWAETILRTGIAMAAGFFLAGVQAGGSFLPLSLSLAAVLGLGFPSFGAYIGGCIGYGLFFGLQSAMEPMAAGLLVEACLCIFGDQEPEKTRWFAPAVTMVFTAATGVLFLLQSRFSMALLGMYGLRILTAGVGAMVFRAALEPSGQKARILCWALFCGGLCTIAPFGFPIGFPAACTLAAAAAATPAGLLTAAFCGLALDLCASGGCTAVLILAALACGRVGQWAVRLGIWYIALTAAVLLVDAPLLLLVAGLPGALLSPLLPVDVLFGQPARRLPSSDPRMTLAAGLLRRICNSLSLMRTDKPDPETNAVFDQAAERVCRLCSRWEICWEVETEKTCEALNRAAPAMMTRGKALREDLPPAFVEDCRHLEGFLKAINRELEDLSCRRQCRRRLAESRLVIARQYRILADALSRQQPASAVSLRFQPELGFRSQGRAAQSLSGDRGVSFRLGHRFYLLLCDGMGTGQAAGREAANAIELLRTLLQCGAEPIDALQVLNGIYILRDDGGFSTVDLLQADLVTGEAELFKWGAAPSYLKKKGEVEKIGTASLPPGLGAGEEHQPTGTKLSLARGELLVLVTDGAGGEAAERFIRQYGGSSPKELASGVVSCSSVQGEDDRTAAVLALRPRLSV